MKPLTLLLTLNILWVASCKKDSTPTTNHITIGDYSNMIINTYDTIISGGYNRSVSFNLDVNNDSEPDFQLTGEEWISSGHGISQHSSIACLNSNSYLLGYFKDDTSFLNRTEKIVKTTDNTTKIYQYFNYTFHRISDTDSIIHIYKDGFKISQKAKNDIITKDDVFKLDTAMLINDILYYPNSSIPGGTDTMIYKVYTNYNNHYSFPLNEIKYIGLKTITNNEEKLGWVKLVLIDKSKILILESAIQN